LRLEKLEGRTGQSALIINLDFRRAFGKKSSPCTASTVKSP